jgi:hypothetical protein
VSATSFADNYTYLTPTGAVVLGTAGNYAILAKTAITTTGTSLVTGNMGISPAAASDTAGFGLVLDPSTAFSTSSLVTGRVYASDYGGTTHADLVTAVNNMQTAYTTANGATPFVTEIGSGNLGGMTLAPGVYKFSTGVTIPTDLTLDAQGDSSAVWIFQIAQTLDLAASKHVLLSNGAQAKNVYWVVAGTTTLGANSVLNGNVLAGPGASTIALQAGSTLNGRAMGQTDVTLISATVTDPTTIASTPVFTSISVTPGPTAGGNNVTITGSGFTGATSVTFDGIPATNVSVFSATQINATAPGHAAGAVDVAVTTPLGVATGPAAYTYGDAPGIVSVATNAAGTVITVTFNKAMADPTANLGNFHYKINGGADQTFSSAVLNGGGTQIDLTTSGTAITTASLVTLSYTAGTVRAADNGALAAFAAQPVVNNMYGAAPSVIAASTSTAGNTITLTFNKVMNDPAGNTAAFSYSINGGASQPFSAVILDGDTTKFDLTTSGTPIALGDVVTVSYTAGTVTAADTGALATFAARAVTNGIPAPTPVPTPAPTATTATTVAPYYYPGNPSGGDASPGDSGGSSSSGVSGSTSGGSTSGSVSTGQQAPSVPSVVTPANGIGSLSSSPLTVDLPGMVDVSVSWVTYITDFPETGAMFTTSIQPTADQATMNAFTTAFHLVGLDINSLAYVMIVQKNGVILNGPATVTMTVPESWVTDNGGISSIKIVRMADDGTTTVLPTSFNGYVLSNGYMTFTATSPDGLSTWGLVATKPYTPAEVPSSGQMAPTQAPAAAPTTTSGGLWPVMGVGGALAALVIVGIALLLYYQRNKDSD